MSKSSGGARSKANQRQGSNHKRQYDMYTARRSKEVNKLKRIARTIRKQPNNTELQKTLTALIKSDPALAKRAKVKVSS